MEQLRALPEITPKMAERLACHLLRHEEQCRDLASALAELRRTVGFCGECGNFSENGRCEVCSDPKRDDRILLVVEEPLDIPPLERAGVHRGRYHVLGGCLSPLEGVGPGDLNLAGLLERIRKGGVEEIVVATNPTPEGEVTAHYLAELLAPLGVKVSRLAYGLSTGLRLQYADELTLRRALENRLPMVKWRKEGAA